MFVGCMYSVDVNEADVSAGCLLQEKLDESSHRLDLSAVILLCCFR